MFVAIEPECDEEGCTSHFTVGCYLPDTDRTNRPDNFYCSEHAEQNGFCKSCGDFWGGVESFEFGEYHGYCDNCAYELERDDELANGYDEEDEFGEFEYDNDNGLWG